MRRVLFSLLALSVAACGAATPRPRAAPASFVEMEELRITAHREGDGSVELDAYDAETLFARATEHLRAGRCGEAVPLYDRVPDEFPASRYVSSALYNAGLCLRDLRDASAAALRFERLAREVPDSPDLRHARFQLADLYLELSRWRDALGTADALLAPAEMPPAERLEAMAQRAQAALGLEEHGVAEQQARDALAYYRTRAEAERIRDPFFAAAANFVLAQTLRVRARSIGVPEADVHVQRRELERRAQVLLEAQREYFNTMQFAEPQWAAAAGYEIGAMYDEFWSAIMSAPTPPPETPVPTEAMELYAQRYREELARLVEPLLRHAVRYWELTLLMIERTGVVTPWRDRIHADLERVRSRLTASVVSAPAP